MPDDQGIFPGPDEQEQLNQLAAEEEEEEPFAEGEAAISGFSLQAETGFNWRELGGLKQAVESRLEPLDFGDVLTGAATQVVAIVPGKLDVTYRMSSTGHRGAIVTAMQEKFGHAGVMSPEGAFHQQIFRLCCGLAAIAEGELPDPLPDKLKQQFSKNVLDGNIKAILSLPDPVFWLVWFNFTWFEVRVQETLTLEALKNG